MRNSQVNWVFPEPLAVPGDFQLAIGGSPLTAKTLYQRGLTSPQEACAFLDYKLYQPCSPSSLPGVQEAANRVIEAVNQKESILVWGDFDVDGQTSTTLLVSALRKIGAIVHHHIPVRAKESHGISLPVLKEKIHRHSPQLIISCDTGIDAIEAIDYATQSDIDVIVTDHHQLPPALPKTLATINPNFLPPDHPLFNLPGVGVAYKLVEEIYLHYSLDPSFLLDLVALGIVADVAVQTKDTRYLLQRGLNVLRQSNRLGLLEIYKINNLMPDQINEEQIGFMIGPRLNALGRLDDANSCVEFFTTDDPVRASDLANQLEELNKTRQILTEEIYTDAESMISAYPELVDEYPVLVLQGSAKWNPGVIGIVASRLVERYHKPVIMLSRDNDQARGSARSIPGVPIATLIGKTEDLLISYGGHPMAAGLSLPLTNVSQFRRSLADKYTEVVGKLSPAINIQIDSEISFREINEPFIKDFHRLSPFGAGNPKLIFASRGVHTIKSKIKPIGRSGKHRKLSFLDSNGDKADFLWWNSADLPIPEMPLDIAFSLEISTYRNQPQVQSTLLDLRHSPDAPVYLPDHPEMELIDLRKSREPLAEIKAYQDSSNLLIWAEGQIPKGLMTLPRSKISKCETLVIWTSPPNNYVLNQIVKKASPRQILIVGKHPPIQNLDSLIESLLGLLKHLLNTGKSLDITRFSEILAMPEEIIEVGIDWIHQHGDYDLERIYEGSVSAGPGMNLPGFMRVDETLKQLLREVLSYRSYFTNAHIKAIL